MTEPSEANKMGEFVLVKVVGVCSRVFLKARSLRFAHSPVAPGNGNDVDDSMHARFERLRAGELDLLDALQHEVARALVDGEAHYFLEGFEKFFLRFAC